MQTILSVSELNEYASTLVNNDSVLCQLCVKGEISGYKRYPSGHAYFQLKDKNSSVSCVIFKGSFSHISFVPENGMQVILYGRASIYTVDGRFQVVVSFMQEDGIGGLFREFEKRKEKMAKEGLFDESHKKPIPYLPKKIGVVTSPKGAVIQDILNVLNRRFPNYDILIAPSSVQGKEAAGELISALKLLDNREDVDVIIIARGGGSMEDLWCFNDEALGRAIYEANTPVISAVGHETDYTICDFCSDLRAPTPSAAAELVMPNKEELLGRLDLTSGKLALAMRNFIKSKNHQWERLSKHRALLEPKYRIEKEMQRCDALSEKLGERMKAEYERKMGSFTTALAKLEALDPMKVLLRGYARVKNRSGQTVDSVKCVNIEEEIQVAVADGVICSVVRSIEEKEGGN